VSWFKTDVLDYLSVTSSRDKLLKKRDVWLLKMGDTGSSKTSALNQLTPRNDPDGGIIRDESHWDKYISDRTYQQAFNFSTTMCPLRPRPSHSRHQRRCCMCHTRDVTVTLQMAVIPENRFFMKQSGAAYALVGTAASYFGEKST
jgi:hypothetical protein